MSANNYSHHDVSSKFVRNYKACDPCRRRKTRCDLGGSQQNLFTFTGPPCAQCRRAGLECVFRDERNTKKAQARQARNERSAGLQREAPPVQLTGQSTLPFNGRRAAKTRSAPGGDQAHQQQQYSSSSVSNLLGTTPASQSPLSISSNAPRLSQTIPQEGRDRLTSLISNTRLLTGNDALDVLLRASTEDEPQTEGSAILSSTPEEARISRIQSSDQGYLAQNVGTLHVDSTTPSSFRKARIELVRNIESSLMDAWEASSYVRSGILSSEHAVTLVEAFFQNMSWFTPISLDTNPPSANRDKALLREPLLCTTVLLVASRHQLVPEAVSESRNDFIHDELWKHVEAAIQTIMLGGEQESDCQLRTTSSIEAILLLSEWYPEALHSTARDGRGSSLPSYHLLKPVSAKATLRTMSAKLMRTDRTRWMLHSVAHGLAHELRVFKQDGGYASSASASASSAAQNTKTTTDNVRNSIFVHSTVLAARLGLHSMISLSFTKAFLDDVGGQRSSTHPGFEAWTKLICVTRQIHAQLFVNRPYETEGVDWYVQRTKSAKRMLDEWHEAHLSEYEDANHSPRDPFITMLFIEFHSIRMWTNSWAMQSILSKSCGTTSLVAKDGAPNAASSRPSVQVQVSLEVEPEYPHLMQVVQAACQVLSLTIEQARLDALRYHPARTFYRILSACAFVFKAILLLLMRSSSSSSQSCSSFNSDDNTDDVKGLVTMVNEVVEALKSSASDSAHPACSYAQLLEYHVGIISNTITIAENSNRRGGGGGNDDNLAAGATEEDEPVVGLSSSSPSAHPYDWQSGLDMPLLSHAEWLAELAVFDEFITTDMV